MRYLADIDKEKIKEKAKTFNTRLEFAKYMRRCTTPQSDEDIDPGVIIGEAGFAYEKDENGKWLHIPHIEGVSIGNDVHIGSHTVIHCGTLDDTIIGDGTKIDTFAHIAHNCKIGKNCIVGTHAVLLGSVTLEDDVWIAPGAVIRQKLTIGKGAVVGMGAVVVKDVPPGVTVYGNPARSKEEWQKQKGQ